MNSNGREDDDPVRPRATSRVVGTGEMLTHRQFEHTVAESGTPFISFREELELRLTHLQEHFTSQGWPPFAGRVYVGGADGNEWGVIDEEWEATWTSNGTDPKFETFPPAPIRIEIGLNFISRRVDGFSNDSWAITEARQIRAILDAKEIDEAIEASHALGMLHQQQHSHGAYLPAVRRKASQLKSFREKSPQQNIDRKRVAEQWHERAILIERDVRKRIGDRGSGAIVKAVRSQLEKEGVTSANGELPSERTIRRVFAKVRCS